jgi:methyl halide transferase
MQATYQDQGCSWDQLWKDGLTPWDLGKPTPLLVNELGGRHRHTSTDVHRNQRILVPGCGAGYDLTTLARHYHNKKNEDNVVIGLDLSPTSLERARQVVMAVHSGSSSDNAPSSSSIVPNSGRVNLMVGDFFINNWKTTYSTSSADTNREVPAVTDEDDFYTSFDFIFDYTFFCALTPNRRGEWGRRMAELLLPGQGRLMTVMFPILPGADVMRGPPFPVSIQDYQEALEPHGVVMDGGEPFESTATVPSRAGKELVCYWTKG